MSGGMEEWSKDFWAAQPHAPTLKSRSPVCCVEGKVVGFCTWTLYTEYWSVTDRIKTLISSSLLIFRPADVMITKGHGCHLQGGWRWGGEWWWV